MIGRMPSGRTRVLLRAWHVDRPSPLSRTRRSVDRPPSAVYSRRFPCFVVRHPCGPVAQLGARMNGTQEQTLPYPQNREIPA